MPAGEHDSWTFNCATIRYLTDPVRDISVPVGVVLWNPETGWWRLRLPEESERIDGVQPSVANTYLSAARAQLEGWLNRGELPYARGPVAPWSEGWWEQVRRLMQFTIRMGPAQPVDCHRPEEEIEALFEALVRPRVPARSKAKRVDGAVTRALGPKVSVRFQRSQRVAGFKGRPVPVLRLAADEKHVVVVEAVNLALQTAERDADALASRLERVKAGSRDRQTRFVLGYLASPGGLNGEAVMKEWLEHKLDTRAYDLDRETEAFQSAATRATADLNNSLGLQWSEIARAV